MIFNRYVLKSIGGVVFLFLACIYFLYILIDYSSRVSAFSLLRFNLPQLSIYYGVLFIRSLEVLLPFALLLGVLRTLQSIHKQNGWVALLTSGFSLKRLLLPFLFCGLLATGILFINEQHFLPYALKKLNYLESLYLHKGEGVGEINERVSVKLRDGSRLFFESIDAKRYSLHDVWHLTGWDEVWHAERLDVSKDMPVAHFVDFFQRSDTGEFIHKEYSAVKSFPDMDFVFDDLMEMVSAPATQSITDLVHLAQENRGLAEQREVLSALLSKLFLPWLALLAVIGPIPFSITFTRKSPFFLVYFVSIFGLLSFYLLIKAAIIVANASVVSPFIAIGIPFLAMILILGNYTVRFVRYGSV